MSAYSVTDTTGVGVGVGVDDLTHVADLSPVSHTRLVQ
jgi:hypothetical protein